MRNISFVIIIVIANIAYGQEYDVRKTNWGMTLIEVKESELPMTPYQIKENELTYKNVVVGNGLNSSIIYSFRNGLLSEILYNIYGYNSDIRGTCDHIIPISSKIYNMQNILIALEKKGYKCEWGWHFQCNIEDKNSEYPQYTNYIYPLGFWNYKVDFKTIKSIDSLVTTRKCYVFDFGLEDNRTSVTFRISHLGFEIGHKFDDVIPCDFEDYNLHYTITFKAKKEVLKGMQKNDF